MKNKLFIAAVVLCTSCAHKSEHADLVIHNAHIYTLDEANTIVSAIAINNGKIIDRGSEREIMNKYAADEYYDAAGRTVIPGFIDAHCHLLNYGTSLQQVNLKGSRSMQEVVERVKKYREAHPNQSFIEGRGWNQMLFENKEDPDNTLLNEAFPDIPVYLGRVDGHSALVNNVALDASGVTVLSYVDGGTFHVKNGKPTGLLDDNAMDFVRKKFPDVTDKQIEEALLLAQPNWLAYGLTTLDDAGSEARVFRIIEKLQKQGKFHVNVYGMLIPEANSVSEFALKGKYNTTGLTVRAFKVVADGALGSRGACLKKPYEDKHNHYGKLIFSLSQLDSLYGELKEYGYQINTHCIGDSAIKTVLALYARHLEGTNDKRWRIEHAQVMDLNDMEYFKKYSIIPSVQPTHAVSDMPMALDRVGNQRLKGAYVFRQLYELNGLIALGTDFPVEDIDPFKTYYAAVSRKSYDGKPLTGLTAGDTLSRMEALRAMTLMNAIASFQENQKGTIEKGKNADIIVLSNDIVKIPEQAILKTKVVATFINGKRVYSLE